MLFDWDGDRMLAISDRQRRVTVVDLKWLRTQTPAARVHDGRMGKIAVEKTGKWEEMADRRCQLWELNGPGEHGNMCVAAEPAPWLRPVLAGVPYAQPWMRDVFDGSHLPLRVVDMGADGVERLRLEVVRIQTTLVPESLFTVPESYQVLDPRAVAAAGQASGDTLPSPSSDP
ncbi:MAG TPA: DUF4412 domain-containing protein [Polyangiaceae bacterium]|nr:DUF4412 domain-containing protein [Polyangiaceae bacterium]